MLRAAFAWISAPLRNDGHRQLSLSRCAGCALTGAELWVILAHPHVAIALQWPAATLLLGLNVIFWTDIIVGKRAAGRVLETLAGRVAVGTAAGLAPVPGIGGTGAAPAPVPDLESGGPL